MRTSSPSRTGFGAILTLASCRSPFVSSQPYLDCDVATYYSSLPTPPTDTARYDMHNLIKSTHRDQLPYSSSAYGDVWDALIDVDSDSSGDNVKLVYKDIWVPAFPHDFGTCEYWNREHLWSRSHGVGSSGKDNTDLHHLRPSDCNVNSARSNLYFGICGTAAPSSQCTSPAHQEAAFDTEKDSTTFLPPVNVRGDIARAILYMDLRYDGDEGSTTLDLVVSDCPETVPNGAGMGYLSQLLLWHLEDPPDVEEKQRNGKVCTEWQGNRNPFIDYPELASIYHGGSRPLLGDGLGYDCTVPPPSVGACSDDSGPCSSVDQCLCSSSATNRNLFEGGGSLLRGWSPSSRNLQSSKLMMTGVFDGPLPGGLPKMVELYALEEVLDLSVYGVGSANNGRGTDGEEFTLTGSAPIGSFVTVSYEAVAFLDYFGETPSFTSGTLNVNGDDAIELFFNGEVVDSFGDNSVDGTGQAWEYMDGWAYRNVGSAPTSAFQISEWTLSKENAVDGCTDNDSCSSSFPFKTFEAGGTPTLEPTPTPCLCLHE
eukprot:CAMPEP_0172580348 /NCGR_PEP_ID=MMETSP1067-20121228/139712_1 /TAXON_ID=265564 ORGANISM="Thalassiosira punctigera, Strain Tpunct2005C2" /NCGR_SAMPLE_ID=MMETSP1067 /ASSEMBLY_ACC=CAM_ASM_000444 /LENGTH=539 /DNA_ID=CAMNT_0013373087 /DNA_START=40 /DNA_END=1659 /DNA_ORIENTATION=-